MKRNFKVIWNAVTPIGTPLEIQGACAICNNEINNYQNHYSDVEETIKVCLSCVSNLSESYESIFNNNKPKFDK